MGVAKEGRSRSSLGRVPEAARKRRAGTYVRGVVTCEVSGLNVSAFFGWFFGDFSCGFFGVLFGVFFALIFCRHFTGLFTVLLGGFLVSSRLRSPTPAFRSALHGTQRFIFSLDTR
jgi:hypothetical protein